MTNDPFELPPTGQVVPSSQEQSVEPQLEDQPSVEMLTAALRADTSDLAAYERVLVGSLSAGFPDGMIEVDRSRSMSDKLAGRPGKVTSLRLLFGETILELASRKGTTIGYVAKSVSGVTISRKEVPISQWTQTLAQALASHAAQSAKSAEALRRLLAN